MKIIKSIISLLSYDELNSQIKKIEKNKLKKFNLTDFEIINIINNKPKSLLVLQLLIDEMSERLTEKEMAEILNIFK